MPRVREDEPVRRPPLHHAAFRIHRGKDLHCLIDLSDAQRDARDVVFRATAAGVAPGGRAEYNVASIALSVGQVDETVKILSAMDPERGVMKGWSPYWFVLTHARHLTGDYQTELKEAEELR